MKKFLALLAAVIMLCVLGACGSAVDVSSQESRPDQETDSPQQDDSAETPAQTEQENQAEQETDSAEAPVQPEEEVQDADSTEYAIGSLNGSIRVPNGYYVFGEDVAFTEQMCKDIGVSIENMRSAMPMLQGQTLIVPSDEPYSESVHFYLRVKEKRYDDITLSDLSLEDYHAVASTVVASFGVDHYETVEGNGLRFFVFQYNQGLGNIVRYATILNGHMLYVYAQVGDHTLSEQQRSDLEDIALSIQHEL